MLSERWLRRNPEEARDALRRRGAGSETLAALDAWLSLDEQRREAAQRLDALAGHSAEVHAARHALDALAARQREVALALPNTPDPRAPDGARPADNRYVRAWGEPPPFAFTPATHDALGAALGILDLPRATRMSGPRFPLLVGDGARVARALAAYLLDAHRAAGYLEVAPPDLVRAETLVGTGHLPVHEEELFAVPRDGLYLSPTAEAQLVALHAGETLDSGRLPVKLTAFTQAFRREAGSAGAKTRGLLRQRQFGKVELVQIVPPEEVDAVLEQMISQAESALQALRLPYRLVEVCAGELPFSARRSFDLEVWLPSLGNYLEIASISDCGTFQSRRLGIRFRPRPGATARHPHTLNGSALPIGRTLAALLEHGQRAGGSVALPAVLEPYGAPAELGG